MIQVYFMYGLRHKEIEFHTPEGGGVIFWPPIFFLCIRGLPRGLRESKIKKFSNKDHI